MVPFNQSAAVTTPMQQKYCEMERLVSNSIIYVSKNGSDDTTGSAVTHPVRTLRKALEVSRNLKHRKTIKLTGISFLSEPLILLPVDKCLLITGSHHAVIKPLLPYSRGIIVNGANGVTISNIKFSDFINDPIYVVNSKYVSILNNLLSNTMSRAWSHGAIHFSGVVTGAYISGNKIGGADYSGIIIDTDLKSDVSNTKINNNVVVNTCRRISDCGAIYVNDRGKRSYSIEISYNTISNFGNNYTKGRGIYLDDFASGVTVMHNIITGPGSYGVQIHGGSNNYVDKNVIDKRSINQPLLYQSIEDKDGIFQEMSNNVISKDLLDKSENYDGVEPINVKSR